MSIPVSSALKSLGLSLGMLPRLGSLLPNNLPEISITVRSPQRNPTQPTQQDNSPGAPNRLQQEELESQSFFDQNSAADGASGLQSLWNGILNAAPKKKTTHQKKRQRQLAPGKKQLKLLNNLNRCPSCGHYKRAHTLCMHCVGEIKRYWKDTDAEEAARLGRESQLRHEAEEAVRMGDDGKIQLGGAEESVKEVNERVLYPGKRYILDDLKHVPKEEYLKRRPKTLPVEKDKQ